MIPDINLLPKKEKKTDRSNLSLIVASAFLLIAIIFIIIQWIILSKSISALESEKALLDEKHEAFTTELALLEAPKAFDLELAVEFIEHVAYPVTPIIIELNNYLAANAYLRDYVFSEEHVAFTVDFETVPEVAAYVENLLKSPFVRDVVVNEMEAFDPSEQDEDKRFDVADRYENTFEVWLDVAYVRQIGGGNQ